MTLFIAYYFNVAIPNTGLASAESSFKEGIFDSIAFSTGRTARKHDKLLLPAWDG